MIRYVQKCEELIAFSCALGCHIFRCTCTLFVLSWHAVLWASVVHVMLWYRYTTYEGWYTTGTLRTYVGLYTTYGGSCNMDCMQCALCVISSRSASELNCDGMRAARNTSFHRSPTLPTFVCFSRNGAGHFQDICGLHADLVSWAQPDKMLKRVYSGLVGFDMFWYGLVVGTVPLPL